MTKMLTPTIHLNGTSKQDLLEQQKEILNATRDLLQVMRRATPNGRDYYPQGPDAGNQARDAFAERYITVSRMYDEFEELALKIMSDDD